MQELCKINVESLVLAIGTLLSFPVGRHTKAESCPKFVDVVKMLNQPEFQVLTWSPEDMVVYDEEARSVGSLITKGKYLYTDLQNVYTKDTLVPFL